MNLLLKKTMVFALPLFTISLLSFSTENEMVIPQENNKVGNVLLDSFPPLPAELVGKKIDTIFTFDRKTKKETISYAVSQDAPVLEPMPELPEIDTIYTFDPVTKKETILIIKSKMN